MQCYVAGVPTAANISAIASKPGNVAALHVPVASAVAVDSAMADVILPLAVLGPQLVTVSAVAVVLTAVDVPGVSDMARVSAVYPSLLLLTFCLLVVFPTFLGLRCC